MNEVWEGGTRSGLYTTACCTSSVRRETTKLGAVRNAPMTLHPHAEGGLRGRKLIAAAVSGPLVRGGAARDLGSSLRLGLRTLFRLLDLHRQFEVLVQRRGDDESGMRHQGRHRDLRSANTVTQTREPARTRRLCTFTRLVHPLNNQLRLSASMIDSLPLF